MPDTPQLLMFIAAGWLLNLTPGPDVLYIVSNALKSGVRAGIVAALGIVSGCFVHVFAAALGVGALLATSATAFTVLKWVGAAYLMWMGVKLLLAISKRLADHLRGTTHKLKLFAQMNKVLSEERAKHEAIRKDSQARIDKVLTPEQRAKRDQFLKDAAAKHAERLEKRAEQMQERAERLKDGPPPAR